MHIGRKIMEHEGFINGAMNTEKSLDEFARHLGNQNLFNGPDDEEILSGAKCALITAASIYVHEGKLEHEALEKALNVNTLGEARSFIDNCSALLN